MTAELLNAACRDSFDCFAMKAFSIVEPGVKYEWNWHIGCISEHLEAVRRGEIPKLIINLPFRSLKSFLASVAFPAWVLGKEPNSKFIVTTYGSDLAKDLSQKCRDIVRDDWYKQCFPGTKINTSQDEKMDWHTTQHGYYYATGMTGAVLGKGANYLIIDDPIKPDEAYSEQVRQSANHRIRNTLFSRFNDPRLSKFIMIMQRLHEDDPTGHLLKDGGYHLLKLPGEAKTQVVISLGDKKWEMAPGGLLFPVRLTREVLDRFRLDMTELNYAGQILQDPIPAGGGEFREEWLQLYSQGAIKPKEMNIVILVDPAGGEELNKKKKKTGDWSVFQVWGLAADNNYYLLDMIRDRLNPTDRVETLFMIHRMWNEKTGKPPKVGYEKYGMMSDVHYIKERQKQDAYHFNLIELGGAMQKEERIRQLIPPMQQSRIYVPGTLPYIDVEGRKFDLMVELKAEMATFPRSRFDDALDCAARLFSPELFLQFPSPRASMTAKAIKRSGNSGQNYADWTSF